MDGIDLNLGNRINNFVVEWKEGNYANGCDFPGNDLIQMQSKSNECGALCDRRRDCTHYTWIPLDNGIAQSGTCWLKKGPVKKSDAISTHNLFISCGLTNSKFKGQNLTEIVWNEGNYANGCDFPGNDLNKIQSKSEECGSLCDRRRECTHYTWVPFDNEDSNNGICWLKRGPVRITDAIPTQDLFISCGLTVYNINKKDFTNIQVFLFITSLLAKNMVFIVDF